MELDDLKNNWLNISNQVSKEQNRNPRIFNEMTKNKYYSSLKKIAYPEIAGVIICLVGATFIALKFGYLNTSILQATGIIAILVLLALSAISLISLRQLHLTTDLTKPYAETLREFAMRKVQFHKLQKINITLSYLLLVATIVLFSKFFSGKDITDNKYFWTCSFTFGYIFLLFYSKWVSRYYHTKLHQAEDLLKELAS